MLYLFLIDSIASFLVLRYRGWRTIVPFMLSSQFFLNYDPVDFFPYLFSLAGIISPIFSIAALLVKIPVGAPEYVWDFIFHSPASIGFEWNWPRYGLLGLWWIAGLTTYIVSRRRKKTRLPTGLQITL